MNNGCFLNINFIYFINSPCFKNNQKRFTIIFFLSPARSNSLLLFSVILVVLSSILLIRVKKITTKILLQNIKKTLFTPLIAEIFFNPKLKHPGFKIQVTFK